MLGATANGTIADGRDVWFAADVPGGSALKVAATFAAAGAGELYVAYERIPELNDAEALAADPTKSTQTFVLATTQAGTYFIRARGTPAAGAGQAFTFKAETLGFTIQEVLHARGSNRGNATLTLKGSGYTPNTTVYLTPTGGGAFRAASSVTFIDKGTVYATFDLGGLATGTYDVRADDGFDSATAVGSYTVTNTVPGILTYRVIQPDKITSGEIASATLEFINPGETDLAPSLIVMQEPDGKAQMRFAGAAEFSPFLWWLPTSEGAPAGTIPPGYRGKIDIEFRADAATPGTSIAISLDEMISGRSINWDTRSMVLHLGSSPITAAIPNDAWDALFANFKAAVGGTTDSYMAALRDAATYLASVGTPTSNADVLLTYLLQQADNPLPAQILTSQVDSSFPTTGQSLDFRREYLQTTTGRNRLGRLGRGWVDNWDISIAAATFGGVGQIVRLADRQHFFAQQIDELGNEFYLSDDPDDESQLVKLGTQFVLTQSNGTIISFRADGQLDFVQSVDGSRVTASYGPGARLDSLTHSSGRALSFTWNAAGRIATVTDPAGRTTNYAYAASGQHLLSVTRPDGTSLYSYVTGQGIGREHALATAQVAGGAMTSFVYDARGRLMTRSLAGGAEQLTYAYGPGGGLTTTDASGSSTSILHDMNGNVARQRDGVGSEFRALYDAGGNVMRFETSAGEVWTYARDAYNRLSRETDSLGHVVIYGYDGDDPSPTRVTDARGNTLTYQVDERETTQAIVYPGGGSEVFVYDPLGNLVETVNRRGNAVQKLRNADGQVTREVYSDGSATVYTYNARGLLIAATNAAGTTTFDYYPDDRPQIITYPDGKSLQFTYDATGRRTQSVDQDGFTIKYGYDFAGRLEVLKDASNRILVGYSYDAAGRLQSKVHANGTYTTYAYDAAGRTQSVVNYAPGGSVNSQFEYTYNAADQIATMTTGGVTTFYGYDLTGQLISVDFPGRSIQYTYDAAGNRTSVTDNGIATLYTVNNQNQVTAAGGTTFTYDLDGNRRTKTVGGITTTYSWDDLSRLTNIASPGEGFAYSYDALGQLHSATHNGQTTTNLNDPFGIGNVWAQYDAGGVLAHYVHGLGLEIHVNPAANESFYDFDLTGSVAGITNSAGSYVNRYSYLPFGETTTHFAGVSNPFTYIGRFGVSTDGNGLLSMRFRHYDAAIGNFVSNDPIGLFGGDLNVRRYVGNNPVSQIDPIGLACEDEDEAFDAADDDLNDARDKLSDAIDDSLAPGGAGAGLIPRIFIPQDVRDKLEEAERQAYKEYKAAKDKYDKLKLALDDCIKKARKAGQSVPSDEDNTYKPPRHIYDDVTDYAVDERDFTNPPAGKGPNKSVSPDRALPVNHQFENPSETLPLPKIKITQQLDPNIDWKTFEFSRVNLGGFGVNVPVTGGGKNTTTMSARVPGPVSWGVTIDLYATVNRTTGLVTWDITALDPTTLEPIADRSRGLMPPVAGNPDSRIGRVYCSMATNAGVANGTQVFHSAAVAFGDDPPIFTTPVSNIIDATPPTSDVNSLPPVLTTSTIPISWTGSDANGNAWYDVYVSDNGGPYAVFQATARTTSANFTGQPGHTYSFYSIATDNVGNVQGAPSAIRTTTIGGAPTVATPAAITPNPVAGSTGTLSVLGADDGGEAALTYTWSVVTKPSGAANPTFSSNGTNAAKNSTATFSQSGSYTLRATISDGTASTTSDVSFTVDLWPAQNDNSRFDVNSDSAVNVLDLIDLIGLIVARGQGPAPIPLPTDNPKLYPDVNGDGQMNVADLVELIDVLVNPPPPVLASHSSLAHDDAAEGEGDDWFAALAIDISESRREA